VSFSPLLLDLAGELLPIAMYPIPMLVISTDWLKAVGRAATCL
jgi:hypothetical protein